jgi:hypothetical protein
MFGLRKLGKVLDRLQMIEDRVRSLEVERAGAVASMHEATDKLMRVVERRRKQLEKESRNGDGYSEPGEYDDDEFMALLRAKRGQG